MMFLAPGRGGPWAAVAVWPRSMSETTSSLARSSKTRLNGGGWRMAMWKCMSQFSHVLVRRVCRFLCSTVTRASCPCGRLKKSERFTHGQDARVTDRRSLMHRFRVDPVLLAELAIGDGGDFAGLDLAAAAPEDVGV